MIKRFFFSIVSLLCINSLLSAQKSVEISTDNGIYTVVFVDDIFDTTEEIIEVTNDKFAYINDEIDVFFGPFDNYPPFVTLPFFPFICSEEYNPVCGSDGLFYQNSCYAELAGVYTYRYPNDPSNPNCEHSEATGVIAGSKRRKRTRGRKAIIQGEFPPNDNYGCYSYYRWEWVIKDYDDVTLELLDEYTLAKTFKVYDTEEPTILLQPNPDGGVPVAIAEDNIGANIHFFDFSTHYFWIAGDDCSNLSTLVLNKSNQPKRNWYADFDGDGFGDRNVVFRWAFRPPNYVANDLDCDDYDSFVNPWAWEIEGNNVDENCDGDYGSTDCYWDVQRLSGIIESGIYGARERLEVGGKLPVGAKAVFQSAGEVVFLPSFIQEPGSNYEIQITPCYEMVNFPVFPGGRMAPNETKIPVQKLGLKIYPNPLQINTPLRVKFSLPETDRVTIDLYDAFGVHIQNLVSSKSFAAGIHQLEQNTNALSNGIYLLKLQTNGQQLTQKLLMID